MTLATGNKRKQGRTRYARAVKFFHANAGYGFDPQKETKAQGRMRCARLLARAEAYAYEHEWRYVWEPDTCIGGDCGETETCEHPCCQGTEHEVYSCALLSGDASCYDGHGRATGGAVLASLGSICEPDDNYKRVVEAELALEAMPV